MIPAKTGKRPRVGVFVAQGIIRDLKMQKGNSIYKIKHLVDANRIAGTDLFFFSINGIDFDNSRINGVYFDYAKKVWAEKIFPFPDVFYDRVKGIMTFKMSGEEVRRRFDSLGIKKLNSRHFFDKWELYRILQSDENLRKHLPATRRYNSIDDLTEMLGRFSKVYLKGRTGSRGRQIMCITKLPDGGYDYRYYLDSVTVKKTYDTSHLGKVTESFFTNKNVIVQQAIDLLSVNGRLADFRGELQRNGKGELSITAIPVRLGKDNSPVSTRGDSYPFETFFKELLHYPDREITLLRSRVEQLLLDIYKYIEKCYGPFGELGIDIGLDNNNRLWFFECNAKSAKVSLCHTAGAETLLKAFLNPLEYARYINSFPHRD